MKPKLTFGRYIFTLLLTVTACMTILATNISKMDKLSSEEINGLKWQIEALENESTKIADYEAQINSLQQHIDEILRQQISQQEQIDRKADKSDRGGERVRYELSADERDLVDRVVTAEARDEPYEGQMLVCQCILNACENLGKRPADIVRIYKYATARPAPTDSVKRAVVAVFDKGERVTDEAIIYFYAPKMVKSAFHESQRFVIEVAGHKFFAES